MSGLEGRNGQLQVPGPATADVSFQVQLEGHPSGDVIIKDDKILITTLQRWWLPADQRGTPGLWEIDASTGQLERLVTLEKGATGWMQNLPNGFMYMQEDEVHYMGHDGVLQWETSPYIAGAGAPGAATHHPGQVIGLAMTDAVIFNDMAIVSFRDFTTAQTASIVYFDLETGEQLARWQRTGQISQQNDGDDLSPANFPATITGVISLTATDEALFALDMHAAAVEEKPENETYSGGAYQFEARALDYQGNQLWMHANEVQQYRQGGALNDSTIPIPIGGGWPIAAEGAVFVRLDQFEGFHATAGHRIWPDDRPAEGTLDGEQTVGMASAAYFDGALFAATTETVYKVDASSGFPIWSEGRHFPGSWFGGGGMAVDGEIAYGHQWELLDNNLMATGLLAFDMETGDEVFRFGLDPIIGPNWQMNGYPGYGPGYAVLPGVDGLITILGQTGASLGLPQGNDLELQVNSTFIGDFSGGKAGTQGAATQFRFTWSDGPQTDWQDNGSIERYFNETGQGTLKIELRNDAGESATHAVPFSISPRPEPDVDTLLPDKQAGLLERAFARDNQDLTFGILGIIVSLIAALIGIMAVRVKRRRMKMFLEALAAGHEQTSKNSEGWRAFVRGWRVEVERDMISGKLTESQAAALGAKATEYDRNHRIDDLEAHFDFLPVNIYRTMQAMLTDGRVTELERSAVDQLLRQANNLPNEQVAQVRQRLDAWFKQDSQPSR